MSRYWRITGIETYGGGDLELSELQLFALDANNNPVRVDQTATLTSSVPPIAGTLSALNDGDTSTTARFPTGPGLAFVWDFGGGGGVDIAYYLIGAGDSKLTFPVGASLQYSSDGIVWGTKHVERGYGYPGARTLQQQGLYDPYAAKNLVLLGFDGSKFISETSYPLVFIPVNGVSIGAVQSPVSSGVAVFQNDFNYLYAKPSSDLARLSTDDWTIEYFVYFTKITGLSHVVNMGASNTNRITIFHSLSDTFIYCERNRNSSSLGTNQGNAINTWSHFAFTKYGNTFTIFQNGVKLASRNITTIPTGASFDMALGFQHYNTFVNDTLYGYLDEFRLTLGAVRYTDNFQVPTAPHPRTVAGTAFTPYFGREVVAQPQTISGADVPPFTTATASPPIYIDIQDGGTGRLTGTVREKTGISTRPLKRRVVLLDYRSNRKLREVVSDDQTGVYSFDEIDLNREYTVIALDHTGQYRAVIADKLVPEKML